jgi:hypothetical protein
MYSATESTSRILGQVMVDFCILGHIMLDFLEVLKCRETESKDSYRGQFMLESGQNMVEITIPLL